MPVREDGDLSRHRPKPRDQPIGAIRHLRGRLTARAPVVKEIPVRSRGENVHGALSFIVAIVPLGQIRFNLRSGSQPRELARLLRALPRAGEHPAKRNGREPTPKRPRLILAARSQGNVRPTGVPARQRPLGFAVSNEVKTLNHVLSADRLYFMSVERMDCRSRRRFEVTLRFAGSRASAGIARLRLALPRSRPGGVGGIDEGFRQALGGGVPPPRAGILVDEEFGASILSHGRASTDT